VSSSSSPSPSTSCWEVVRNNGGGSASEAGAGVPSSDPSALLSKLTGVASPGSSLTFAPRGLAEDEVDPNDIAGAPPNELAFEVEDGLPNPNPTGFPMLPDPGVLPNPVKSGAAVELVVSPAPEGDTLSVVVLVEELVLVPPNRKPLVLDEEGAGLLNADEPEPLKMPVEGLLDAAVSASAFAPSKDEPPNRLLPKTEGVEEDPKGLLGVEVEED